MRTTLSIILFFLSAEVFSQPLTETGLLGKWTLEHERFTLTEKFIVDGKKREPEKPDMWLRFKTDRELDIFFFGDLLSDKYKVFKDTLLVLGAETYRVLEFSDSSLVLKQTGFLPKTFFYQKEGFTDVFKQVILEDSLSRKTEQEEKKKDFYMIVQEMPSYPDGDDAALLYLAENIDQKFAEDNPLGEKLYVEFIVETDGSIGDVKLLYTQNDIWEKEVTRVLTKMPKWNPGKQKGKPVRVKLVWPVNVETK
jgi:hypothetical protein